MACLGSQSIEIRSQLFGLLPFHVPLHHIPDGGALLSGNTVIPRALQGHIHDSIRRV